MVASATMAAMVTTRRRLLMTAAVGIGGLAAIRPGAAHAQQIAAIDPATTWGTWEGWGTSLCWWANVFGNDDAPADLLFTSDNVQFNGVELPGLAMNIVRYNAGACTSEPVEGESMVESPNIPDWKQIQGFWLNWNSDDPASDSFDWSVDAAQRAMLAKAQERGVDRFELFSNSPLWWMCINHNPSGADDGGDNLQSWNYQQHARYLAIVAKYAHDNWGIDFTTADAFNEPSADWWAADGTQEGCHISPSIQAEIIGHLRTELDNRGLTSVQVSASDESLYDQAYDTWTGFSAEVKANVAQVNVHGYQYEDGQRDDLYSAVSADGKALWQSEWGDGDGTGLRMAQNFMLDMRWLRPTAWVYWQAFDGDGWGLVQADVGAASFGPTNTKYFVHAQLSRHIRPGMQILESGHDHTVAAYDADAARLVLVTANFDTAQDITYDLAGFSSVADGVVPRWVTTLADGGDQYASYPDDTNVEGQTFTSSFPANTIQTFEISDAVI